MTDLDIWMGHVTSGSNEILRVYLDVDGIAGSYRFSVGTHIKIDYIPHDAAPGNTTFIADSDTPSSYSGQAGKFTAVNSAENALEFVDAATGPAGPKGDKGDKGDPGQDGTDGTDGTNAPTTFTGLTDTPGNFTGQGGKHVAVNSGATALEFVDAPTGGGTSTPPSVLEYNPTADVVITTPSTQGHATNTAPRWSDWTTLMECPAVSSAMTVMASAFLHVTETGTAPPGGGQRMFVEGEFVRVGVDGTTETVVGGALDFYIRHFDNGSSQLGGNMVIPVALAIGERVRVKVRARRQNNLNDSVGTIVGTFSTTTNHIYTAEMR